MSEFRFVAAEAQFSRSDTDVKTRNINGFEGVIAERYSDSEIWPAPYKAPNEDAPNVI